MGGCAEHIRARGGRVSGEQARWMDALKKQGYACTVCYSWDEVFTVIQSYMRGGVVYV